MIETKIKDFTIREAQKEDLDLIYDFMMALAKYEQIEEWIEATKESLYYALFVQNAAEVIIAEYQNTPVGFAVYYHTFSTLVGKTGLHVDDLFILEDYRGKGFGKTVLAYLAKLALSRNCGRFEWWCLKDNYPSIEFYQHLKGEVRDELLVFRLKDQTLNDLAEQF